MNSIATLSPAVLALSGLAGFLAAMLAARIVRPLVWRPLGYGVGTLVHLRGWCAYAVRQDEWYRARLARGRYAALIDGAV